MSKQVKYTNVVLDLETLSLKASAHILSIGAVCLETGESYYCVLGNREQHRSVDSETHGWWDKQSQQARDEVLGWNGHKPNINSVLSYFSVWLKALPGIPRVWGNGADFDNVILADAYRQYGYDLPWNFRNNMCLRTLRSIFKTNEPDFVGTKHNALHDAQHEAAVLEKIITEYGININN